MNVTTIYLCGPVENDANASDWRDWWTSRFMTIRDEFGRNLISVLNPLIKPAGMPKEAYWLQSDYWSCLMKKSDMSAAYNGMRACIDMCRSMVAASDIVLCRLPKIFTVGTIEELILAKQLGKKVFFSGPEMIPSFWLLVEFSEHDKIEETFYSDKSESLLDVIVKIVKERNEHV